MEKNPEQTGVFYRLISIMHTLYYAYPFHFVEIAFHMVEHFKNIRTTHSITFYYIQLAK